MLIFISYRSGDRALVETLVNDLDALGHTIWFDQELTGGHAWWNSILNNVRDSDVFIFALSPQSLDSYPCQLEYSYADALGKRILPVLLKDINNDFLPPALSKIQFVDYRVQDKKASIGLARALGALPPSVPLPDPLPTPPEAPVSGLGRMKERVESNVRLSLDEQAALVLEIKGFYQKADTQATARDLLERFRNRTDLFASIEREIQSILGADKPVSELVKSSPSVEKTVRVPRNLPKVSLSPVGIRARILSGLWHYLWAYAAALIAIAPLVTIEYDRFAEVNYRSSAFFVAASLIVAKLLTSWLEQHLPRRFRLLSIVLAWISSIPFMAGMIRYSEDYFYSGTSPLIIWLPVTFITLGFVIGSSRLRSHIRLRLLIGSVGVLACYFSLFIFRSADWSFPLLSSDTPIDNDLRNWLLTIANQYNFSTWAWYIAVALACSVLVYWPELGQRQTSSDTP